MRRAALAEGWDAVRVLSWLPPEDIAEPFIYGETMFADVLAEGLGLVLLEPAWDWLPSLPVEYRSRATWLSTLGAARTLTDRVFVKPVDEKIFPARVYYGGGDLRNPPQGDLPDSTPVLISEPVIFDLEVRAFVLENEVRTMSAYLRSPGTVVLNDEWGMTDEERAAASEFLAAVLAHDGAASGPGLPPACVVDVGLIRGRGWAVVEANPCWASGLYGCDPREALHTVRRASVPRELDGALGEGAWWGRHTPRACNPLAYSTR
jgi:hypothetical protein